MTRHRHRSSIASSLGWLACVGLTLALAGCRKPAAPSPAPAKAAPIVKSVGKPLTDEEGKAVAEKIDEAINAGDAAALNRIIDWNALFETSTAGVDAPKNFRDGFIQGGKQSQTSSKGLSYSIVDAVQKGGSFTFLRNHTRNKRPWLLYRLLQPDSGVSYYNLALSRRPGGQIMVVDFDVLTTGELMSQTMRRMYIEGLAKNSGSLVARLSGAAQENARYYARLKAIGDANREKKFAEVLSLYKDSPVDLQKEKFIKLLRLHAAQSLGNDEEYLAAFEDLRANFPDDICSDLMAIDYNIMKKRFPDALVCVERLDRAVGGDPYLETFRANIHLQQNDPAAARADLNRALAADPNLGEVHTSFLSLAIQEKNHDETLKTMRLLRDQLGYTFSDLSTEPDYKDFVASPQYQEWLKDQPPKARDDAKEATAPPPM